MTQDYWAHTLSTGKNAPGLSLPLTLTLILRMIFILTIYGRRLPRTRPEGPLEWPFEQHRINPEGRRSQR